MQIIDLADNHKPLYFLCLEEWSSDIREAGNHKSIWYDKMKEPLSYRKIRKKIERRVKKIRARLKT